MLRAEKMMDPVSGVNFKAHTSLSVTSAEHNHDFMELFLIAKGEIWHLVNGESFLLRRGDLVLTRPNDRHSYRRSRKSDCELVNLAFPMRIFREAEKFYQPEFSLAENLDGKTPPFRKLGGTDMSALLDRMKRAGENLLQDPVEAKCEFKLLLLEMLGLFKHKTGGRGENSNIPSWLSMSLSEMRRKDNFSRGIPALRKIAGRSGEHISRSFRLHLNTTPTDFINGLRIRHAASRLLNSDEKIEGIAGECGFENISHFYHAFKRTFKLSPGKYRNSLRRDAVPA